MASCYLSEKINNLFTYNPQFGRKIYTKNSPFKKRKKEFNMSAPKFTMNQAYKYHLYKKKPVLDRKRWLMAAINNDWNESEEFNNWYKYRKDDIVNNGNDDLKQLLSI